MRGELSGSVLLATALNVALRRRLPHDVYARLVGKRVEIAVTDWRRAFSFVVTPRAFVPARRGAAPDLRIGAAARDFGAIAAGEADADTLYFNRRLVVEGDSELALLVKNTLDALEGGAMRRIVRAGHRLACAVRGV